MPRGDQIVIRRSLRRPLRYQQQGIKPGQRPPLPSVVAEYWHSELDASATAWIGQLRGLTLLGTGAPTIVTDPGFFNGRVIGRAAQATTSMWVGSSLAGLPVTGSRPWGFAVARMRTAAPAGNHGIVSAGTTAVGNAQGGIFATAASFAYQSFNPLTNLAGPATDVVPRRFKAWKDVTNKNFQVDATLFTAAEPGVTTADINAIGIGGFQAVGSVGDANVAFFMLCSAKPSDAEIAALDAWAVAYWGLTPQTPPLPTSAVEYWHSELGCTPSAWVGQIAGMSLAGTGTPVVAADTGFFRDRVVAQAATVGNKAWRGNPLTLPAAGTRPWVMVVGRLRATSAATQQFVSVGFDAATIDAQLFGGATAAFFGATFSGSGNLSSTVVVDTAVRKFKGWRDGVNRNVKVDAVTTSSADTGSAVATNTVAIGCQSNGAGGFANASIAFVIICSAKPTADEEAALDAWAQAYWNAP